MKILSNNTLREYRDLKDITNSLIITKSGGYVNFSYYSNSGVDVTVTVGVPIIDAENNKKELKGFTISPFSNDIKFLIGEFYVFNEPEEIPSAIYPVYDYIEYVTPIDLKPIVSLYKNSADRIRVDKTDYLTFIDDVDVTFRDAIDIVNPVIIIKRNSIDFNYCYIRSLNRYYFVSNFKHLNNNLIEIDLQIDILMSNKNGIYNLDAFIDRNEFTYNLNLIDTKRVIESGVDVETRVIETDMFKLENSATGSPTTYYVSGTNIQLIGGN